MPLLFQAAIDDGITEEGMEDGCYAVDEDEDIPEEEEEEEEEDMEDDWGH